MSERPAKNRNAKAAEKPVPSPPPEPPPQVQPPQEQPQSQSLEPGGDRPATPALDNEAAKQANPVLAAEASVQLQTTAEEEARTTAQGKRKIKETRRSSPIASFFFGHVSRRIEDEHTYSDETKRQKRTARKIAVSIAVVIGAALLTWLIAKGCDAREQRGAGNTGGAQPGRAGPTTTQGPVQVTIEETERHLQIAVKGASDAKVTLIKATSDGEMRGKIERFYESLDPLNEQARGFLETSYNTYLEARKAAKTTEEREKIDASFRAKLMEIKLLIGRIEKISLSAQRAVEDGVTPADVGELAARFSAATAQGKQSGVTRVEGFHDVYHWSETDDGKVFIRLKLVDHDGSRMTDNFDHSPFAKSNRKVHFVLENVRDEDASRVWWVVKSDVAFGGDGDRLVDDKEKVGSGNTVLVEKRSTKDYAYYLAGRWDRGLSEQEFFERNPSATVVMTLVD